MGNDYDIYLRPLCVEDAKTSYKWRNNPEVWKNTGSSPDRIITEELEMTWIHKVLADSTTRRYAICLKSDDRYIGNIYLTNISGTSAIEQIFIGEIDFWGKGIGTKARAALYAIAKNDLGLIRIESHIRPRNIASLKSVLKLGFTEIVRDSDWIKLEKIL